MKATNSLSAHCAKGAECGQQIKNTTLLRQAFSNPCSIYVDRANLQRQKTRKLKVKFENFQRP